MYLGPEKLKEIINNAELYPIQGLFSFKNYFHEIDAYYHRVLGDELGLSTGWRSLDEYYNVSFPKDFNALLASIVSSDAHA